MAKRVFLNVIYNLAILVFTMIGYWGLNHAQYGVLLGAIFAFALVVYLKVRLIKEVKETAKKR